MMRFWLSKGWPWAAGIGVMVEAPSLGGASLVASSACWGTGATWAAVAFPIGGGGKGPTMSVPRSSSVSVSSRANFGTRDDASTDAPTIAGPESTMAMVASL